MNPDRDQLTRKMGAWQRDIVKFGRELFGFEPTAQQLPILKAIQKPGAKVALKAGHGVGKTAIMALTGIWHTLLWKDSKCAATAPSATQLKDVLMSEIGMMISRANPWVKTQLAATTMRLEVKGCEATQFLTARTARPESPDALQGLHASAMMFLVDEAFGVADPIFEVARGALSTKGARVLLAGNPTSTSGYAFQAFHRNKHLWQTFTLSCKDCSLVDPSYVEEMAQEYGEDSDVFKVRVLGQFPGQAIHQLISRAVAEAAAARRYNLHDYHYAPVVIGVDPAWEGDDRSCIVLRQGVHSRILAQHRNIDSQRLGGLVNQYWTEHKADAVFVDIGWGAGVIDYLRAIGRTPIPVNFGGKALKEEYANKRTEMWCEMGKWLAEGGQVQKDDDIVEDLIGPEVYFLPNGKKILEQKKTMKKRGLRSPDLGDALALTFAAPVAKMTELARMSNDQHLAKTEFDVLA